MKYHLTHIPLVVRCDRLEALRTAKKYHYLPTTDISNFNLVSTLHKIISSMLNKLLFYHVEGHRDLVTLALSQWEIMNITADIKAKEFLWKAL